MFAGGLMAMSCAAGHAIVGFNMFYRPIKSAKSRKPWVFRSAR
jgi:hypothetical protein